MWDEGFGMPDDPPLGPVQGKKEDEGYSGFSIDSYGNFSFSGYTDGDKRKPDNVEDKSIPSAISILCRPKSF